MRWTKHGHLFTPDPSRTWSRSHAQVPTVDASEPGVWRIYYATRDDDGRSRTSWIEVEEGMPEHVLRVHDEPILPLGRLGAFDDCGVMPSWILTLDGVKYLYYIGWTVRNTIPYHNSIGLAVSDDRGATFNRFSDGPLLGSTWREPFFNGTACVLVEDGLWRMWYLSCTGWEEHDGRAEPYYHIKYAESRDGVDWRRDGKVAIDYASPEEGGIVKASVLHERGRYRMWYSYRLGEGYRSDRTRSYRIGYAESPDGLAWQRMDDTVGIDVSDEGWDDFMLCYPHVVRHDDTLFMFHNGNGFGASGLGWATMKDPI